MENIEIKNFGPIKHVKLDLKDINVFIGTTASGKSTVAKLVAIFRSVEFISEANEDVVIKMFSDYNIDFTVSNNTYIKYEVDGFFWELKERKLSTDFPFGYIVEVVNSTLKMFDEVVGSESITKELRSIKLYTAVVASLMIEQEIVPKNRNAQTEDIYQLIEALAVKRNELVHNISADTKSVEKDIAIILSDLSNKISISEPLYIPAERNLLSMVGESVFGLLSNNVSIAAAVKEFGAEFEAARKQLKQLKVGFLSAEYKYADNNNILTLENGTEIKLEQASSGFQSIIPLLLVIEAETNKKSVFGKYFIIEEPELNLYPTVQKDLLEFVVERINKRQDKLIITTHSPYILTALDNLIQADNVVRQNSNAKEEVKKLVPSERWVNFDRVACYYFENGTCRSTLDEEQRSIGPSNIDDVSDAIGSIYDQLLAMKYDKVL